MPGRIPEMMLAAEQHEPGGPLTVSRVPVPVPGKGEVLVRIAAAPINPSDLSMLRGTYATRPGYPVIPGLEGSGLVVAAGNGIIAKMRNGKRVACTSSPNRGGTWSEYMVTSAVHTIPIGTIPYINGAMAIVNPLTALALINIARVEKHRAAVNNAAASSLGRMLVKLFRRDNVPLINIVRTEYQENILKKVGADNILNSSDTDFADKLSEMASRLGATLVFDAIGGEQTNILLNSSPAGTKVVLYANLSESDFCAEPRAIIQKGRKIEGFFLGNYTSQRGILSNLADIRKVKKMITGDLGSTIAGKYPLPKVEEALNDYRSGMTRGKILIIPDPGLLD